jgi:Phage holin protein (Holin_LLH).
MIDITLIVIAIIALAAAGAIVLVIYLRSVLSADKLEQLENWVKIFVSAAEKIFVGSGRGKEKIQYVADMLKAKGYTVNIDSVSDAVRAMIEATVLQLGK